MTITDVKTPPDYDPRAQVEGHRTWQVAYLAGGSYRPKPGSPPPLDLFGDWSGAALSGLDLRCADFRRVDAMADTDLKGADLRGAQLDGVDLRRADLTGAQLDGAAFRDADLSDAHLAGATGLSIESLAGADLRSTRLPEDLGEFSQLEGVAEASKYTQSVYRLLLILCGFAALTAMSVRDENLVLRDGQSLTQLPLLQADVSPQVFAYVMPALILLLYGYQALYTVSLWRLFSFLPAYFPDGSPLDRRAYPAMTNIFVRYALRRIENERNDGLSFLLHWFIAFGVPPMTLAVVWLAGLRKHDWFLSLSQGLALGLGAFLSAFMLALSGSIIRNEWRIKDVSLVQFLRGMPRCLATVAASAVVALAWSSIAAVRDGVPDAVPLALLAAVVALGSRDVAARSRAGDHGGATSSLLIHCLALAMALHAVALGAFGGENFDLKSIQIAEATPGGADPETFPSGKRFSPMLWLLSQSRLNPFLDFRNKVVSKRPADWKGQGTAETDQISLCVGADLEQADLRSVDAERAFLARANFRGADLRGAYLRFAYLREADLSRAKLDGAYLRGADLRDANLHDVDLGRVILAADYKDPTTLIGPNFQGVRVRFGDLKPEIIGRLVDQKVNNLPLVYFGISGRDLDGDPGAHPVLKAMRDRGLPWLTDAELGSGRLRGKVDFQAGLSMSNADLSGFVLRDCTFKGVDLGGALFVGADLTGVDFTGAVLDGANFTGAALDGADFTGAKVAGAIFTHSTWFKARRGLEGQADLIMAAEGRPPARPEGKE